MALLPPTSRAPGVHLSSEGLVCVSVQLETSMDFGAIRKLPTGSAKKGLVSGPV